MSCVCHAFASVHCYLVVTCWERADLLALSCEAYCDFVTSPCGILGQVWYLIVSIPDFAAFLTFIALKLHYIENYVWKNNFILKVKEGANIRN